MSGGIAFPLGADARLVEVYAYDKPDVRVDKLDIKNLDPKVFVKRILRGDKEPKADNATGFEQSIMRLQLAAAARKAEQQKVETLAPEDPPKQTPQDTPTDRTPPHPVTDVLLQKVKFTFHWRSRPPRSPRARSEAQGKLLFVFKVGEKLQLVNGVVRLDILIAY